MNDVPKGPAYQVRKVETIDVTGAKIIAINAKSVTFSINGEEYLATKRVANDIINHVPVQVYVQSIVREMPLGNVIYQNWLATPSRF